VGSKDKESGKEEEVWTCGGCKKDFKDANSKLLECERCDGHYCVRCAKMSDDEYELLSNRKDIHWFCGDCDTKAMQSIQLAKEMDKKLGEFMKNVDENLKNIEKDIEKKLAEKANTAQVMEQMKDLETRINKQLQDRTSHKEMDEALMSYAEITKTTIKQDLTSEMSEVQKH